MEKQVKELLKDKFYSLIAEGVEKFPMGFNLGPGLRRDDNLDRRDNSAQPGDDISNCTLCPLSQTRKKVVVSSEIVKKKFFILSEFPELEDENSQTKFLFSEKSSSGLIVKLLEKLGLLQDCHFSFALKCVPEKGLPKSALSICAKNNLKTELASVNPEIILCFGQRAIFALAQFEPSLLSVDLEENSSNFKLNLENTAKTVFFLSSSRDLQAFPHWRNQVWKFLEPFKANSH